MPGRDRNLPPLRSEKSGGGSLLSAGVREEAKTLLLEMSPEFGAVVDSRDDYICSAGVG
jgi:hypothetical protein